MSIWDSRFTEDEISQRKKLAYNVLCDVSNITINDMTVFCKYTPNEKNKGNYKELLNRVFVVDTHEDRDGYFLTDYCKGNDTQVKRIAPLDFFNNFTYIGKVEADEYLAAKELEIQKECDFIMDVIEGKL